MTLIKTAIIGKTNSQRLARDLKKEAKLTKIRPDKTSLMLGIMQAWARNRVMRSATYHELPIST
jgi:hypothetical protein